MPEPPADFERVVWARVQTAIAGAGSADRRWTWRQGGCRRARWRQGPWLGWAVALVNKGGQSHPGSPNRNRLSRRRTTGVRDRVFYTALDRHFRQTETLFIELRNAPDRDSLEFERVRADDLISDGRLYRLIAEIAGHPSLAQVLEDLEPVLVEVARGPERRANDRAWLRARIEEDD